MSTLRRSPAIPLSPSSPPESGLKPRSKRRLSEDAPGSPTTPPMSVATKSYAASYENAQSSAEHPSQTSSAFPEAPSAFTQQSTQPITQSVSTPASSASEIPQTTLMEDKHRDKRQKMDVERQELVGGESIPLPTNHDRQSDPEIETRAVDDFNSSWEDASFEILRKDMGNAFLLCKSTITRSRLDSRTHLLSRFGLGPLLRSVARTDPLTGEKINKLRKSYEGQIQTFELSGRNKAVKAETLENLKRPLRSLVEDVSEEEWQERYRQRPIEAASDFRSRLTTALQIQPGVVRNSSLWEKQIGHEVLRPAVPAPDAPTTIAVATAPVRQPNGTTRSYAQSGPSAIRPKRAGKKRSYFDDSFEGYGEGFGDDDADLDDGAFDDEDEGGGSARKKRKKEHSFSASPISYGAGYMSSR